MDLMTTFRNLILATIDGNHDSVRKYAMAILHHLDDATFSPETEDWKMDEESYAALRKYACHLLQCCEEMPQSEDDSAT